VILCSVIKEIRFTYMQKKIEVFLK